MVLTLGLWRFGRDEGWWGAQVGMMLPDSWFMVVLHGPARIKSERKCSSDA